MKSPNINFFILRIQKTAVQKGNFKVFLGIFQTVGDNKILSSPRVSLTASGTGKAIPDETAPPHFMINATVAGIAQ